MSKLQQLFKRFHCWVCRCDQSFIIGMSRNAFDSSLPFSYTESSRGREEFEKAWDMDLSRSGGGFALVVCAEWSDDVRNVNTIDAVALSYATTLAAQVMR